MAYFDNPMSAGFYFSYRPTNTYKLKNLTSIQYVYE